MLSATHNVVFINVISLKKNKPKFVKVRQVHVIKYLVYLVIFLTCDLHYIPNFHLTLNIKNIHEMIYSLSNQLPKS